MKKLYFVLLTVLFATISQAQVASYTFSQSVVSYTPIVGGTVLGTATSDDQYFVDPGVPAGGFTATGPGFPIGFNFSVGANVFDRIGIQNNGWISLGQSSLTPSVNMTATSTYFPISSAAAIAPAQLRTRIAGIGRDIQAQAGSELRIQTIGSTPNQVCVIQFTNYKKFGTGGNGDNFSFQIRISETSNVIDVVYNQVVFNATSNTAEVGLGGSASTEFNNRTTSTNWNATTAGVANTDNCTMLNTVTFPVDGRDFKWTPPTPCTNATPFGTAAIDPSGAIVTISNCNFAGDYSTITGAVNGQTLRFTSSAAGDFITVRSGSPAGPVVALGQTPLTFVNTFTGTLYVHWNLPGCGTQNICRTTTVQCLSCLPTNELCTGAFPISCGATVSGTTLGYAPDAVAACNAITLSGSPGVWYTFVGNGQSTTLSLCGSSYDTEIGVFSGSCAALTCVTANDDFCGFQSQVTFPTTNGTTYYVLVTGFGTGSQGTFTLAMTCASPIANDVCSSAININCGQTIAATTVGAGADIVPACNAVNLSSAAGVWYSFVGTGSNNTLSLCGSGYDTEIGVFTGTCGALVCNTANDDFCGLQSQVTLATTAGTTYYVLVTGFGGGAGAFTLNRTCAPPPNDLCSGAININCGQTITGATTFATTDVVATCSGVNLSTAPGLWYSMVGDGTPVTLSLCGSSYDTELGVFSGSCGALNCVVANDDFCSTQSQVTFTANAGQTYYILVTGWSANTGNFTLLRTCAPPCAGVPSPGSIAPATQNACVGSPVTLTVSGYSANSAMTFQWSSGPAAAGPYTNIAGANGNIYTFNAPAATTYYRVTITCTNGGGNATTAPVVVNVSNMVHNPIGASPNPVCSPGATTISATVSGGIGNYSHVLTGPGTIGPAVVSGANNQNVSFSVTNIPAGTQTYTLTTTDGIGCTKATTTTVTVNPTPVITFAPPAPVICAGNIQQITATVVPAGTVTWNTTPATNPVTGLYTDALAQNQYAAGTPTNTVYAKPLVTTTYTATTTVNGCTNSANVTVTVNQLPAITVQPTPASQVVCPGFTVTYTVTATGAGLTYQWRRNGVNLTDGGFINGSTTNTLVLSFVSAANSGTYDVVVSGTCPPAVTSNPVVLTVATTPVISTQPANTTVCSGQNATFTVATAGSTPAPTIYQWQVSTDGGATWTNLTTNGSFTPTLTVPNTTTTQSGNRYRVIVTNSCGQSITSSAAILTVNLTPTVVATDLFNTRVCVSDTLIPLVGTPTGGSWSGIGVSGFNFVPTATAVGTYVLTYTFTSAAGCTASDTTTIKVQDCPERERLLTRDAVILYPNPNNGQFSIRINSTLYNYLGMKVYDMSGRLVNGKVVKSGLDQALVSPVFSGLVYGRVVPIDISYLTSGTYLVKFYYDDGARSSEKGFLVVIAK